MSVPNHGPTVRRMFTLWLPLAVSQLMMVLEPTIINIGLGRTLDPEMALAAYGVAFSLGMFFESPIIMMLSAANVLVKGRRSYLKLRRFNLLLNLLL